MKAAHARHRSFLWSLGAPVRALLVGGIRVYQSALSGAFGGRCKYYPSCSRYAVEAIRTRGALVGSGLTLWRLVRCNPLSLGGVDHVPHPAPRNRYDPIIREPRSGRAHASPAPDAEQVEA